MAKKELQKKLHSQKEIMEINKYKRVVVSMNTGTITMKSPKDYDRKKQKKETRKMIREMEM